MLRRNEVPRRVRARAVLKWFGAKRRGVRVVAEVETALRSLGIAVTPPLSEAGLDSQLEFCLATNASVANANAQDATPQALPAVPEMRSIQVAPAQEPNRPAHESESSDDQLEPEGDDEGPVQQPDDRPVTSHVSDWTIAALRDKLDRGQCDLQPRFQREYVWALRPELPSRLIESLLLEIPIPPIYFGKTGDGGRLEVIDGQQRLTTLVSYASNGFALSKLHRLPSLNGRHFRELTPAQQEKLLDSPIRSIVIDAGSNAELRYEIFERLNRGSMALNEQELRNCVYRGPFNDLLAELEIDSYWRKAKGGGSPEPRFKEREMILRFFAFSQRLGQYGGNLKRFLNEFMSRFAPREPQDLRAAEAAFHQTMQNIYAVFGEHACRLYDVNPQTNRGNWDSKFSVTAMDIQASALMNQPAIKVQRVADQLRELFIFFMLTDVALQDAVSKRTASTAQTQLRWTKFRALAEPVIAGVEIEPRFFSFEFRRQLYEQSDVCALCHNPIHVFDDATVDHIVPYARGGKTEPNNAQLAHRGCNASKCAVCAMPASAAGAPA